MESDSPGGRVPADGPAAGGQNGQQKGMLARENRQLLIAVDFKASIHVSLSSSPGWRVRPVLGQVPSGPGRAAAGGRGADRAVGPEPADPRVVGLRLVQPSERPAQTRPHSQAVSMVRC